MATNAGTGIDAGAGVIFPKVLIEDWAEYAISDGSHIRAKLVVFKLLGVTDSSIPTGSALNIGANLQVAVSSPPELKGRPENLTPGEISAAPKESVTFRAIEEPWNYYLLPGLPPGRRFLKVRFTIVSGSRVSSHFDGEGNPLYSIQTGLVGGPATADEVESAWRNLLPQD